MMLAAVSPPATGDEEIGNRVQARRKALRMNQAELAKLANKSQSWISGIERGSSGTDIAGLRDLARALDVTVAWLLGEPPVPGPERAEEWASLSPARRESIYRMIAALMEEFGQEEEPRDA